VGGRILKISILRIKDSRKKLAISGLEKKISEAHLWWLIFEP
jgi:hypothetical protein